MTPDIIAARQDLDLRPQLERLDRLICWSEDIGEGALSFAFRPLWQLDEPARAALALSRAQATQVYAGLKLWPDAVMTKLAVAQLIADGTYPNAAAVFADQASEVVADAREVGEIPPASGNFWQEGEEPRDWHGRWMVTGGGTRPTQAVMLASAEERRMEIEKELEGTGTGNPPVQSEDPPDLNLMLAPALKGAPKFMGAGGSIKAQPTPAGSTSGIKSAPAAPPVPGGAASSGSPKGGPASPTVSPARPQSPPATSGSGTPPGQTGPQSTVKTQAVPGGGASVAPNTGLSSSLVSRLTIPPPAAAIRVTGNSPGERGKDYEAKILSYYGLIKLEPSNVPGSIVPKSRIGDLCFEVKYQDEWK